MTNTPHYILRLESENEEALEMASAMLMDMAFTGIVETAAGIDAFVPIAEYDRTAVEEVLQQLGVVVKKTERVEPTNWNLSWETTYEPVLISNQLLIRAPFHEAKAEVLHELVIEPKMSFGTGHHETTRLMCQLLLDLDVAEKTVIDMGCGTGVLGILALKLGAATAMGIDVEEWAVENSRENAIRNGTPQFVVEKGDAALLANKCVDVLLANINRNILLADLPAYGHTVEAGGRLLLSGFYEADAERIIAQANAVGFTLSKQLIENRWVALRFQRNP